MNQSNPPWNYQRLYPQFPNLTVNPRMSEFSGRDVELVPGALRGYRTWRLSPAGELVAKNFHIPWHPNVNTAVCAHFLHEGQMTPVAGCTCGFYALHEPDLATSKQILYGSIKAYGKVILGTKGFRAQHAEIECLVVPWDSSGIATRLAYSYTVPVVGTMSELVEKFPPIPVDGLLEKEDIRVDRWAQPTEWSLIKATWIKDDE